MAGRKCTVCAHKQVDEINTEIVRGGSLKAIAAQYGFKSDSNVQRHTQKCLGADLQTVIVLQKEEVKLTVTEEFQKQLEYAKQLREAAMEVLSDPDDPLKLTLDPWAHEIEVIHYDQTDLNEHGKPKKKRAPLSTLIAMLQLGPAQEFDDDNMRQAVFAEVEAKDLEDVTEIFDLVWDKARRYFLHVRQSMDREAEKVSIKHIDLRKFALEAVSTTDMTIDKLAKIEGIYKADETNDPTGRAVDAIKTLMAISGFDKKQAMEAILQQQRERNVIMIEPAVMRQIAKKNGIMELEGIIG